MEINNPAEYFYVCEGSVLKNIEDMLNLLKTISEEDLAHHFNSEKNDFLNWTRDILKDKVLTKKFEKAKTRDEMILDTEKRLKSKSMVRKKVISQIRDAVQNG